MTVRSNDPATSHLAATYISGKRPALKDAFLVALKALGPSTANEIAAWCVQHGVTGNAESVRKRAKELIDDGVIRLAGTRQCKITNQQAGTVEFNDAFQAERTDERQQEESQADGRAKVRNPEKRQVSKGTGGNLQSVKLDNPQATPEVLRVDAVVEFMRHEREYRFIPEVANEMFRLSKLGTWPAGDPNEYIAAIDSAALRGLIERSGSRVRAMRQKPVERVVQQDLFD